MTNLKDLGQLLRYLREKVGKNMQEVALKLDIDRSYLSKVENGHERPSEEFLNKVSSLYSLLPNDLTRLLVLSGYRKNVQDFTGKEVPENMEVGQSKESFQQEIQVNIPESMDVLYCDSVFITSSPFGVVLSFAQSTVPNKQKVISRIGMSKDHAKALIKALENNLEVSEKAVVPSKKIFS